MPTSDRPEYIYNIPQPEDSGPARGGAQGSPLAIMLIILAAVIVPGAVAYGLGTLNELQVLAIVLGVFGVLTIMARPFIGLILFIVLLYTRPEEAIPALAGMHFTLLVAVVTLLGGIIQMVMDKQKPVRTPMNGMILCFGVAVVLSAAQTGDALPAIQDIGRLVLLVLLIINLTRTRQRYDSLVTALLVVTTYLALYSIFLFHTGSFIVQDGQLRTKATGIFSDPNDLAATFVAGVSLAIMRVMQARRLWRVGYAGILGILLYAIIISNSRGGFLALIAVAIGFFVVARMPRTTKIAVAVVGIVLLMGVSAGRMTNYDTSEASANSRFWFWSNGCKMLMANPLLGIGYGRFPAENGGMTAHNSFVLCFGELGLVGYAFWLGAIYYCFKPRAREVAGPGASPADEQNLFAARMGLAGYLAASFWLSHTYTPIHYVFLALPIAAQISMGATAPPETNRSPSMWRDFGRVSAIALGSFLFIKVLAEHYR